MPPRCTPPITCSGVGPSCCTGRAFPNTTGRAAPAAATSLASSTGRWLLRARPSAAGDPLAPNSHQRQDRTHIPFGVVTAGVFTRNVKLEASWFNGREPDENRTNFDYAGRRLDSYSARLTVNPGPRWSLSTWY